mgnify:CR=1 FL=1
MTTFHRYDAPGWGVGELWVRDGRVVAHELVPDRPSTSRAGVPPQGGASTPEVTVARQQRRDRADFVPELCRRFRAHLAGERVDYADVPIDTEGLTALQVAMAEALRRVPWGEVVTYGELAARAGRPGAARAAGAFCAEGRWSLVVPFHRVVAADGIGGYGSTGVGQKRRLLAIEGIHL